MTVIEKHVTSLEVSKQLKALGFPQKSVFYWAGRWGKHIRMKSNFKLCSAYLASELGEWLLDYWSFEVSPGQWTVTHLDAQSLTGPSGLAISLATEQSGRYFKEFYENTEADCRAKMLIYLVENRYLDPSRL